MVEKESEPACTSYLARYASMVEANSDEEATAVQAFAFDESASDHRSTQIFLGVFEYCLGVVKGSHKQTIHV